MFEITKTKKLFEIFDNYLSNELKLEQFKQLQIFTNIIEKNEFPNNIPFLNSNELALRIMQENLLEVLQLEIDQLYTFGYSSLDELFMNDKEYISPSHHLKQLLTFYSERVLDEMNMNVYN